MAALRARRERRDESAAAASGEEAEAQKEKATGKGLASAFAFHDAGWIVYPPLSVITGLVIAFQCALLNASSAQMRMLMHADDFEVAGAANWALLNRRPLLQFFF
jgi:hypothetical protein